MLNTLTQHPFQLFQIESFSYCRDIKFENDENSAFEGHVRNLDLAFQQAVKDGSYWNFVTTYTDISSSMLKRGRNTEILRPLLENALIRLIVYINHFRMRSRSHLTESGSVRVFNFDTTILADARRQADEMERTGKRNMPYDLNRLPELKRWVREELQPLIEEYIGFKVVSPGAEIRFADAEKHGAEWKDAYRHHVYGNYHLDQNLYALPFIVYLDDVDDNAGPFTFVEGSDKFSQNYILRAFHQALTFRCDIGGLRDRDFAVIGSLPSIFRGGDLVGAFTGPTPFEQNRVVNFNGPAGTAVLFEGFHLVHSGGHPLKGTRKSLFVNFRYPRYKVSEAFGKAAALYWRHRTRNVAN